MVPIMNETTHSVRVALTLTEWIAIASLIISVGCVVFTGGFVYGQVQGNSARLDKLEPKVEAMSARLERIDTNVEWLREQSERRN